MPNTLTIIDAGAVVTPRQRRETGNRRERGRTGMIQGTVGGSDVRSIAHSRGFTTLGDHNGGLVLVVAILLGLSWMGMGYGGPGDLDPAFGVGGVAITFGPRDIVRAMIQQPDGKLVLAGTSHTLNTGFILLVRYLSDGRGDTTFGSGGKVTVPVGNSSSANALVLQFDGKLVVAGWVTVGISSPDTPPRRDLLLARFSSDGHLDATFGAGGVVTTAVESNSTAFALIQQPDGKLVVAGTSDPTPVNNQTATAFLVRYHSDGRVDASFGRDGTLTIGPGGFGPVGTNVTGALIRQPDGNLVVAPPGVPLHVVRVQPDGRLDTTFGSGGTVTIANVDPSGDREPGAPARREAGGGQLQGSDAPPRGWAPRY